MFLLEVIRLSIHAKTVSAVHMKKRVSVLCSQLRSSAYQTKKIKEYRVFTEITFLKQMKKFLEEHPGTSAILKLQSVESDL